MTISPLAYRPVPSTVRVLTALCIVGACTLVIARGLDLARFSFVYSQLDDKEVDLSSALAVWKNDSGVGIVAREAILPVVETWDEKEKTEARRQGLTELLAVKPLSSGYWLSLARMRLATRQDLESVAKAMDMSVLTGANEGSLMWQRATFDLMFWNFLPHSVRARAALELHEDSLSAEQAASIRLILSEKSDQERREIRNLFQSRGGSKKLITTLGL